MAYRWVGLHAALAIHDLQIVEHGGAEGLRFSSRRWPARTSS
jgi:hypothetical protein